MPRTSINADATSVFLNVISYPPKRRVHPGEGHYTGHPDPLIVRPNYRGARPKEQLLCHSIPGVLRRDFGPKTHRTQGRSAGRTGPEFKIIGSAKLQIVELPFKSSRWNCSLCRLVYYVATASGRNHGRTFSVSSNSESCSRSCAAMRTRIRSRFAARSTRASGHEPSRGAFYTTLDRLEAKTTGALDRRRRRCGPRRPAAAPSSPSRPKA